MIEHEIPAYFRTRYVQSSPSVAVPQLDVSFPSTCTCVNGGSFNVRSHDLENRPVAHAFQYLDQSEACSKLE